MRATLTLTLAIMLFTVVSAVMAGDSGPVEAYKFRFDGNNGPVRLELNSQTMGFGLRDLQPGDSRTTVTEDGTSITISRLDDAYALDLGGEIFEIPAMEEIHDVDAVHASQHRIAVTHGMDDGLTILSKNPLDETQRNAIRDALLSAGIADPVKFLSPNLTMLGDQEIEFEDDSGAERRMVIKRVIAD